MSQINAISALILGGKIYNILLYMRTVYVPPIYSISVRVRSAGPNKYSRLLSYGSAAAEALYVAQGIFQQPTPCDSVEEFEVGMLRPIISLERLNLYIQKTNTSCLFGANTSTQSRGGTARRRKP